MNEYVLKHKNSDFLVSEQLLLNIEQGKYSYYLLQKSGKSTFQCIRELAEMLEIDQAAIGYAGLKDEDGITLQHLSIFEKKLDNIRKIDSDNSWFFLTHIGDGRVPIRIGKLDGNLFEVIVRNLSPSVCTKLSQASGIHKFINYFDTQRFGLPGFKKLAHKVGHALLNANYDGALLAAWEGGNISDEIYACYRTNSKAFWEQNDHRQNNFFLNAYDAYIWNTELSNMLSSLNTNALLYQDDMFAFTFSGGRQLIVDREQYPIGRHRYQVDNTIKTSLSTRNIFFETTLQIEMLSSDEFFPSKQCMLLKFFLPSGCYATMLVKQLINQFAEDNK